jgi:hypothetical protein
MKGGRFQSLQSVGALGCDRVLELIYKSRHFLFRRFRRLPVARARLLLDELQRFLLRRYRQDLSRRTRTRPAERPSKGWQYWLWRPIVGSGGVNSSHKCSVSADSLYRHADPQQRDGLCFPKNVKPPPLLPSSDRAKESVSAFLFLDARTSLSTRCDRCASQGPPILLGVGGHGL